MPYFFLMVNSSVFFLYMGKFIFIYNLNIPYALDFFWFNWNIYVLIILGGSNPQTFRTSETCFTQVYMWIRAQTPVKYVRVLETKKFRCSNN